MLDRESFWATRCKERSSVNFLAHSKHITSSERASADPETDSSGSEAASKSAAPISDFDAYLNSLYSTVAAEASETASAKSDLTDFAEALVDVERLGRLKLPNVWDIIFKYPLLYN